MCCCNRNCNCYVFQKLNMLPFVLFISIFFAAQGAEDITFFQYSNDAQEKAQPQSLSANSVTIIIIHGWLDNASLPWIQEMAQLYHKLGKYNVLAIDWSKEASENYLKAQNSVQKLAEDSAKILLEFISKAHLDSRKIHVIGHSLGAHFAGVMCNNVGKSLGKQVGRLTGLDVAGPLFELPPKPNGMRFSKDDAEFVDAVHTNVANRGALLPYGNVDFYVNGGGMFQPGCNGSLLNIHDAASCSHQSSHIYYAQALKNPGSLIGYKCPFGIFGFDLKKCDKNQSAALGEFTSWKASGVYYIKTENSPDKV